jgi:hypothetical protein
MKLSGKLAFAVLVGAVVGLALGYVVHGGAYRSLTSWLSSYPGDVMLWVIMGVGVFGLVWRLFSR